VSVRLEFQSTRSLLETAEVCLEQAEKRVVRVGAAGCEIRLALASVLEAMRLVQNEERREAEHVA
jgi:methionine aminopeptidase